MIAISKRRRFLKWTGLGACLFFGFFWLLGLYVTIVWIGPGDRVGFVAHSGAFHGYRRSAAQILGRPGWHAYVSLRAPSHWMPRYTYIAPLPWPSTVTRTLTLPLWIPFVLALTLTVFCWRARVPRGCCPQCGYDLTGNVSGHCPECGSDVRSATL